MRSPPSVLAFLSFCSIGMAAALPEPPTNTPSPMLQPAFGECLQFHIAGEGEDCNAIIAASRLSRAEFFRINPAVGGEAHCKDKVIPHTWYCVQAKGGPSGTAPAPPSRPQSVPRPTRSSSSPTFQKSKNPGGDAGKPGEGNKKDGESKPPAQGGKKITQPPKPKITKGPEVPDRCYYGRCWYEFAQLSFKGQHALDEASDLCTKLFNAKCDNQKKLPFPGAVNEGCKDCAELSSACPCFTGKKFHTYTNGPMFHPEWFNNPPDVFGPHDFHW